MKKTFSLIAVLLITAGHLTADRFLDLQLGRITGQSVVAKFGKGPDCDSAITTDIWDGASGVAPTWVAPTEARVHAVVSTDVGDTAAGAGARTVRIFGLTDWTDSGYASETVTLNGTTPVNTQNSYVIIHRGFIASAGDSGPNIGNITMTAATDATVTAQILAGEGQTQMAIYGIPAGHVAIVADYQAAIIRGGGTAAAEIALAVNNIPTETLAGGFRLQHTLGVQSNGSTFSRGELAVGIKVDGPAIIKVQANATANNTIVHAGFDFLLVDLNPYN